MKLKMGCGFPKVYMLFSLVSASDAMMLFGRTDCESSEDHFTVVKKENIFGEEGTIGDDLLRQGGSYEIIIGRG